MNIQPESSLGISSPTAHSPERLPMYKHCRVYKERLYGLVTILTFVILQGSGIFFTPAALMGFTSQSFLPNLKRHPFSGRLAPMRLT
jgi:hypothetical protein